MILNNIIKYIILSLLICPLSIQSFAQGILTKKKSFAFSNDTVMRVNVDGYLDGNNTSFKIGYGAYKYYLPLYEPLVRMRITNSSNHILENISIVTSEKQNMYNVDTIANIIFKSKLTDLEKLFTIYNYLQNQYFYFYTPEYEGNQEVSDLIKFLGVYGYGHCGTFTSAFDWLAYKCNLNTKIWILAGGGHAVNEVKINDKNIIIDSDNGGYYLNYNNKTLASYSEIFYDSYLYKRTKHFGPLSIYNIEYNYQFYGNWIYWHWDNYTLDTYPFSSINHSLNFNLRPNESISFNNTNDVLFHHILIDGYYPIAGQAKETIRNGNFELVSNFLNTKSELLFHDYSNIKMYKEKSSSPNLHSENNSPSYFIIEISSPFVFVNAKINFSVQNITLNDSLKISFSKDLVHWKEKWKTSKSGTYSDSLDLYTDIAPLYEKATYKYYLRFDLFPNDSSAACGFDSINIKSIFQVSKHFMPKLFSGENIIKYSDATITPHSNINIELQWNEYFFNTPPEDITEPVFPQDNTQVDSLHFTFKWNTPNDLENDAIVDYHFQLSDRPDMLYVLAPNFDQYLYEINNTANSFYKPEVDGFLNPGQTYYWRVRSLDSRGAWSEWSPTFSFTPHGPAQPVNFSFYVSNKDTLVSCLPNKSGNVPLSYEFHTSNEARGFYPNQSTIFKQTRANYISISELNRQYFRVYAIDSLLNKSTVSHYIDKKSILRANVIDNFILHEDSTFYINLITSISNISGKSKPIVEFSNTNNITIRELSYDFEIKTKHDWFGQDSVLITIKDSLTTYNKYIKFNCLPVNDPPKPTKILQQISLNEDEVISKICLSALFENIDNDTLYYRLVIFDKKINIAIDNDTLLLYSKPNLNGIDTLIISASDGQYMVNDTIPVIIVPVNDKPIVQNKIKYVTLTEDTDTFNLAFNDVFNDVDNSHLTYNIIIKGNKLGYNTFNDTLSVYSSPDSYGTDTLVLSSTDGQFIVYDTIVYSILPINDKPYLANELGMLSIKEDLETYRINLGEVFQDVDNAKLTYSVHVKGTTLGSTHNRDELAIFSQPNKYGLDTLILGSTDGQYWVYDTVPITIVPVNDAPYVTGALRSYYLAENGINSSIVIEEIEKNFFDVDSKLAIRIMNSNIATRLHYSDNKIIITVTQNRTETDTLVLIASDEMNTVYDTIYIYTSFINTLPLFDSFPQKIQIENNSFVRLNLREYISDQETKFEDLKFTFPENDEYWEFNYDSAKSNLYILSKSNYYRTDSFLIFVEDADKGKSEVTFLLENLAAHIFGSVYPNPVKGKAFISYNIAFESNIVILISDIYGNNRLAVTLNNKQKGDGEIELETEGLSEGIYVCSIFAISKNIIAETKFKMIVIK